MLHVIKKTCQKHVWSFCEPRRLSVAPRDFNRLREGTDLIKKLFVSYRQPNISYHPPSISFCLPFFCIYDLKDGSLGTKMFTDFQSCCWGGIRKNFFHSRELVILIIPHCFLSNCFIEVVHGVHCWSQFWFSTTSDCSTADFVIWSWLKG